MRNIKLKFIAVFMVVALMCTGCMKEHSEIIIAKDGSVKLASTLSFKKDSYLKMMEKSKGTALTEAEILEADISMKAQGFSVVTIEDEEYYQATEKKSYSNKAVNKEMNSNEGTVAYITKDIFYINSSIESNLVTDNAADAGIELTEEDLKDIQQIYEVEFTAPIKATNGVICEDNPNRVKFEITMDNDMTTVFASTKAGVTEKSIKATIKKLNTVAKSKILKLTPNKVKKNAKKATVNFKFKSVKGVKYQVQYSTKKSMKGAKIVTFKKAKGKISALKKGKKYFVKIRTTKKNYAGQDIYSNWSKAKTVVTKK